MSSVVSPSGKWDARYLGPVVHDSSYYAKCMLGGVLACGVTHAGITPLDVAKCNMQVSLYNSSPTMNSMLTYHRSTPQNTRASSPPSSSSQQSRAQPVSGRASVPLSSDTPSRECSSTVSTKSSRTTTPTLLVRRLPTSTSPSSGSPVQPRQRSLPISPSAPSR
jgi:hypothetical protein